MKKLLAMLFLGILCAPVAFATQLLPVNNDELQRAIVDRSMQEYMQSSGLKHAQEVLASLDEVLHNNEATSEEIMTQILRVKGEMNQLKDQNELAYRFIKMRLKVGYWPVKTNQRAGLSIVSFIESNLDNVSEEEQKELMDLLAELKPTEISGKNALKKLFIPIVNMNEVLKNNEATSEEIMEKIICVKDTMNYFKDRDPVAYEFARTGLKVGYWPQKTNPKVGSSMVSFIRANLGKVSSKEQQAGLEAFAAELER